MLVILHTNKYTSGKKLELDMAKGSSIIQATATRISAIGKIENPNFRSRASHYIKILKARSIPMDDSNGKVHLCKMIDEDPTGKYYRHFQFLYDTDNEGKDVPYMVNESVLLKTREQVEDEDREAQEQESIREGKNYNNMKKEGYTKSKRTFHRDRQKTELPTTKEGQKEKKKECIQIIILEAIKHISPQNPEGIFPSFNDFQKLVKNKDISINKSTYSTYLKEAKQDKKYNMQINNFNNSINKKEDEKTKFEVRGGQFEECHSKKPLRGIPNGTPRTRTSNSETTKQNLTNESPKINNSKGKKAIESKPKKDHLEPKSESLIESVDLKKGTNEKGNNHTIQVKPIDPLSIEKDESLMKLFDNISKRLL